MFEFKEIFKISGGSRAIWTFKIRKYHEISIKTKHKKQNSNFLDGILCLSGTEKLCTYKKQIMQISSTKTKKLKKNRLKCFLSQKLFVFYQNCQESKLRKESSVY